MIYRTISEQVADRLRNEILGGIYKQGNVLKEQELSNRFQVSRGTIRHALMQLTADGLVDSTPNVGMRVSTHPSEDALSLIYHIRSEIELFALRAVSQDLRNNHLDKWRDILVKMQQSSEENNLSEFKNADIQFHKTIVDLYPDKHISELWNAAQTRLMMRYERLECLKEGYLEHKRIMEAVEQNKLDDACSFLSKNIKK